MGIRHRTAHIWVVWNTGDDAEVLMQKRAMNKDSFPGRYDTSSAEHIHAGDEPLESALRELEEELGIKAEPVTLEELTLQEEELDGAEWFNLNEVIQECEKHNQKFCAPLDGLRIIRNFT